MTMLADLQSHIAEAIRQAQGFRSVAVICENPESLLTSVELATPHAACIRVSQPAVDIEENGSLPIIEFVLHCEFNASLAASTIIDFRSSLEMAEALIVLFHGRSHPFSYTPFTAGRYAAAPVGAKDRAVRWNYGPRSTAFPKTALAETGYNIYLRTRAPLSQP